MGDHEQSYEPEGQLPKMGRRWVVFHLLLLMTVLATFFGRWIVFELVVTVLLTVTTLVWGMSLCFLLMEHGSPGLRRTLIVMSLMLFFSFSCCFLTVYMVVPPTKTCHLESLTMASCTDHYERFGNHVPEPAPCAWKQRQILGLIFIGKEIDKKCPYYDPV